MNKENLCELLNDLAKKDLTKGADIYEHPCSVAARALDKCIEDINYLRTNFNSKCKKAQMLMGLTYDPEF